MSAETKSQMVAGVVAAVEKQYGKGALMKLGDAAVHREVPVISTGSLGLDLALGVGGLPRGRIAEVYGPESSGKTTLALHAIAEAQKAGGVCAFIDAEHALDVTYAKKLGVKTEELLLSQPDHGEQALEITDMLVRSEAVDMVVVDSVAALVPKAELEGDMGDSHVGLQARLMSQALRKLTGSVARSHCLVLFINQLRMKIGVMFGSPETTTGGNALKFYASVRLDIRRIGTLKDGDTVIGGRTRVKVVKNKLAAPFREAEFDVCYGIGISRLGELVDLGVDRGICDKSGSWLSYQGTRIGQGRDAAIRFLAENAEIEREIRSRILATAGLGPRDMAKTDGPQPGPSEKPAEPAQKLSQNAKTAPLANDKPAAGKTAPAETTRAAAPSNGKAERSAGPRAAA
jgi:recombination protein RecA